MSVDDSLAHTITEDQQPRSHHEIDAVSANIVCNVVYTSFESENSANFTTDNDSHIAPGAYTIFIMSSHNMQLIKFGNTNLTLYLLLLLKELGWPFIEQVDTTPIHN